MRIGMLCVLLVITVLGAGAAWHVRQAAQARERGRALFQGDSALPGRIAGNEVPLPGMATRCANCHETASSAPAAFAGSTQAAGVYATALDRAHLVRFSARRRGPPSRFDTESLCTLLRTGIDPGHIIVSTVMPRYAPSDAECADLWTFLVSR
jgi:hypothetical protein